MGQLGVPVDPTLHRLSLVLLAATSGGCAPAACPEGFTSDGQGLCLQDADPGGADSDTGGDTASDTDTDTASDTDTDSDCSLLSADDRLDIWGGCVDGACNEMPYAQIVLVLGEPVLCDPLVGYSFCDWQGGQVSSFFDDPDADGVVDDSATAHGVYVRDGWSGASPEGLGLDVAFACYIEEFGETDEIEYINVDGEPVATQRYWPDLGLFVDDGNTYSEDPDGLVDGLSLFGATGEF